MIDANNAFIADFHIHSRYSRATSADCTPESLEWWARRKGLSVIGTGDFTHPLWRQELREKLEPAEDGLYRLKRTISRPLSTQSDSRTGDSFGGDSRTGDSYGGDSRTGGSLGGDSHVGDSLSSVPRFLISGEISSIYKKNGRVRKVHNLILLPSLDDADTLADRLEKIGNLHSDGRPILGLDCHDLLEITLEACPSALLVPAHIWTPHFSVFGAYSGFDDITECFEDLTEYIVALETGLSSDPPMNWRLSALDRFALISNSDAHSPAKLAREANLFATEMGYDPIIQALKKPQSEGFLGTIEFFPEEGKYHFDGHRNCNVCMSPTQTITAEGRCPVCGGALTVGVLHRVEELADRPFGFELPHARSFESLVPLPEVIAASTGLSPASKKGVALYEQLLRKLGPELSILRTTSLSQIEHAAGDWGGALAEGIRRLREGEVELDPGFDGAYGSVRILEADEIEQFSGQLKFSLGDEDKRVPVEQRTPVEQRIPAKKTTVLRKEKLSAEASKEIDATEGLNEEQQAAVFSSARVIAVQAGPGTGKTRTLIARIIYLIEECGVAPSAITALTFTNKAAREMRVRLERHFGEMANEKQLSNRQLSNRQLSNKRLSGRRIANEVHVGTFHAIALELLRQAGQASTVINEASAQLIMEGLIRELGLKLSSRDALRELSMKKSVQPKKGHPNNLLLPDSLFDAYNERLQAYGVMDFDDILLRVEDFCKTDRYKDNSLQGSTRFSHLLVDEFQDSNPLQYHLIQEWSISSASLFVIGDPQQSIYGFRGADARCFDWLRQDYPGLFEVRLTRNYRSTPAIIDAALPVLAVDAPKLSAQRLEGPLVRLAHTQSPFSEALFIAKEINRLVGGIDMLDSDSYQAAATMRGFSDIAVLYRTNRQAEVLEECLKQEGIPYTVTGRDKTLTHPDLAKTLAFFQLLLNPSDQVALMTCLNLLFVCPYEVSLAMLKSYQAQEKSLKSLSAVLENCAEAQTISALKSFAEAIQRYGISVRKKTQPQKLLAIWMSEYIKGSDTAEWADRLLRMAVFHHSIEELLFCVALGQEGDIQRYGGKHYLRDAVSLMTLHAAKGLEFPVVFLCGVTDGLMPLRAKGVPGAFMQKVDCQAAGIQDAGVQEAGIQAAGIQGEMALDQEAEERRLLFVGMTRAEDELTLINHGKPSYFLTQVPSSLFNTQQVRAPQKVSGSQQISIW